MKYILNRLYSSFARLYNQIRYRVYYVYPYLPYRILYMITLEQYKKFEEELAAHLKPKDDISPHMMGYWLGVQNTLAMMRTKLVTGI